MFFVHLSAGTDNKNNSPTEHVYNGYHEMYAIEGQLITTNTFNVNYIQIGQHTTCQAKKFLRARKLFA